MSPRPARSSALLVCGAVALMAALGAPGNARARTHRHHVPKLRVLFIGNSYTRFNNLPVMVRHLAASAPGGPRISVVRETHGGYDLRRHFYRTKARALVRSGRFTHVVLQDHSLDALDHPDALARYAGRFKALADRAGEHVILYETWAREPGTRFYRERPAVGTAERMQARIAQVYGALAGSLHVALAPVGPAWQAARREVPGVALYRADHTHPSLEGTYLSASVLWAVLTGGDPTTLAWRPHGLDGDMAAHLRAVARESVAHP